MSNLFPKKPNWLDVLKSKILKMDLPNEEQMIHLSGVFGFLFCIFALLFYSPVAITFSVLFNAAMISLLLAYPVGIITTLSICLFFGIVLFFVDGLVNFLNFFASLAEEKKELNKEWERQCRQIEKDVERDYRQATKSKKDF